MAAAQRSVTHLLRQLVGVQDARHRHLQLVFLLLGLAQRQLPLLQEQVRRVLAGKLLQETQRGGGQQEAGDLQGIYLQHQEALHSGLEL